ncbi:MAG: TMEM175 family protein [Methylacidiphilaceae bacterium]|nr:TMEM175 family protein [Candidatus Methylacidiphilaceae bacterium]
MEKGRLEAFSDGAFAILITITVLELKAPHGVSLSDLSSVLPLFLNYVLSFLYLGIYWNNHHHLLKACRRIHGGIMWANLHLLFWLSLFPFATDWAGENHSAPLPTAIYGAVLFLASVAYFILQYLIITEQGCDSKLAAAIGRDWKGRLSSILYASVIPVAFFQPWIAQAVYALVALLWLVPDRRLAQALQAA